MFRSLRASSRGVPSSCYQQLRSLPNFPGHQFNHSSNPLSLSIKRWETSKAEDHVIKAVRNKETPATGDGVRSVKRKKTMAELDAELREKLEALSGDGGSAGVEYENGTAEGLKRGVKANMFRVI